MADPEGEDNPPQNIQQTDQETPKDIVKEPDGEGEEEEFPETKKEKEKQKYAEEKAIYENPKCNPRLMEMAKPNIKLALYNLENFKNIYPPELYKAFLKRMKEELAKKPEEIEDEFIKVRDKEEIRRYRNALRKQARKLYLERLNASRRASMLKILQDILVKYITRAYFHPKQIIMTTRLRRVSNIILRELCRIRGIPVPKRDCKKLRSLLMFSTADFFAYCIDAIYYELQVQKVVDYDLLKEEKRQLHQCFGTYAV